MNFRRAVREDWPAISHISSIAGYNDYISRWGPSYMDDGIIILAEDDGPAGFSRIDPLPDGAAWLSGLRVDPVHRKKGIGMMLTEKSVEISVRLGALAARMLIEDSNAVSRKISGASGFVECGRFAFLEGTPDLRNYSETAFTQRVFVADGWRFLAADRIKEKTGSFATNNANMVYSSNTGDYHHIISITEPVSSSGRGMTVIGADAERSMLKGFTTLEDFPVGIVYERSLRTE